MRKVLRNVSLSLLVASVFAGCSDNAIEKSAPVSNGTSLKALTTQCAVNKTILDGASYVVNNNIWGSGAGAQCVWYQSSDGSWGVNASHTSGSAQNIKGYPALVRGWIWYNSSGSLWARSGDASYPTQLSAVASLRSNWSVTVPTNGEKYNTSYDIWLDQSSNPNHKAQYEIMVWINYQGPAYNGSDFLPVGSKIASNVGVAGHTWNVYRGSNGSNNVFSFRRATNTSSVSNLDLLALINYAKNQGFVQSSYYLLGVQAGFEIVAGGVFKTNSYSSTLTKL